MMRIGQELFVAKGEIGPRIKKVRESFRGLGMRQAELARRIGVSPQRLANWESGNNEPSPLRLVNQIAQILEVDAGYLATGIESTSAELSGRRLEMARTKGEPETKIKIYGSVSAGTGEASSIDFDELDVPAQFAREDYGALIIEGDSMMPFLHPSDIAIFRDWRAEKPGYIMAAQVEHQWVVKKLVYEEERYKLRSLNKKYPDIETNFRPSGYLVGLVRDDGPERLIRLNPYGLRDE